MFIRLITVVFLRISSKKDNKNFISLFIEHVD